MYLLGNYAGKPSRAVTIKLIANCLIGALSQVVPGKVAAFNAKDSESTYQYQAFGVPQVALKFDALAGHLRTRRQAILLACRYRRDEALGRNVGEFDAVIRRGRRDEIDVAHPSLAHERLVAVAFFGWQIEHQQAVHTRFGRVPDELLNATPMDEIEVDVEHNGNL